VTLDLVRVHTARGAEIAVLAYGPRRPRQVALVVGHGYSSSKHNLDFLCGFLAGNGFHVFSLDFPGHKLGASGGHLDSPEDLTNAMAAAVGLARERHAMPIYTMGHSMGATTALRACAADPEIAGAISIATGYGRPAALDALAAGITIDLRSAYVDGLTLQELVAATEPLLDEALPRLAGRPVLYVTAERDMMVTRRSAETLFERAPEPKTFVTIDSDHTSAGDNARAPVVAWLNQRHPR
jgi:alpha-beta hydrolase superfamily lysophospholipase